MKNLKKISWKTVALILSVLAFSSCREELGGDISGSDVIYGYTEVTPDNPSGETRSLFSGSDSELKSITLFAFDANGEILVYADNAGSGYAGNRVEYYAEAGEAICWLLPQSGNAFDIYAVANMGDLRGDYSTLEELLTSDVMEVSLTDMGGFNETGIPMRGILEDVLGDSQLMLPMTRIVAKYNLSLKDMTDDETGAEYELVSFDIYNANGSVNIFGSGEWATKDELIDLPDYATDSDVAALNSGGTVGFYVPENMQTSAGRYSLSDNTEWSRVRSLLGETYSLEDSDGTNSECTYAELTIKKTLGDEITKISRCLFFGRDCRNDFDIVRNRVQNLSLSLAGYEDGPTIDYIISTITPVAGTQYEVTFNITSHRCQGTDIKLLIKSISTGKTYDWPYTVSVVDKVENEDGTWNGKLVYIVDIPSDAVFEPTDLQIRWVYDGCIGGSGEIDTDFELSLTMTGGWWDDDVTYDVHLVSSLSGSLSTDTCIGEYTSDGGSATMMRTAWEDLYDAYSGQKYLVFAETGTSTGVYSAKLVTDKVRPVFKALALGVAQTLDISPYESRASLNLCDNWWYGEEDRTYYIYLSDAARLDLSDYTTALNYDVDYLDWYDDNYEIFGAPFGTVYNYEGAEENSITYSSSQWKQIYETYCELSGLDMYISSAENAGTFIRRSVEYASSTLLDSKYLDYEYSLALNRNAENDELFRRLIYGQDGDYTYEGSSSYVSLSVVDMSPADAVYRNSNSSASAQFRLYGRKANGDDELISDDVEWRYTHNVRQLKELGAGTLCEDGVVPISNVASTYKVTATYEGVTVPLYGFHPYLDKIYIYDVVDRGYFYTGLKNHRGLKGVFSNGHVVECAYSTSYKDASGTIVSNPTTGDKVSYNLTLSNESLYNIIDSSEPGLSVKSNSAIMTECMEFIDPVLEVYSDFKYNSADASYMCYRPNAMYASSLSSSPEHWEYLAFDYEIISTGATNASVYVGRTGSFSSSGLYYKDGETEVVFKFTFEVLNEYNEMQEVTVTVPIMMDVAYFDSYSGNGEYVAYDSERIWVNSYLDSRR